MSSLFQVGNTVELWRVLLMLSMLVAFIVAFEQVLHCIERHVDRHEKYHQMLRKIYRELMVLGFIGLIVKLSRELIEISEESLTFVAFEVADMMIFILALVLIFQSVCVYLWLRRENTRFDHDEILTAQDLLTLLMDEKKLCIPRKRWQFWKKATSAISKSDLERIVRMRTLRHYFLTSYALPQIFPFADYMREAQDRQIFYMIDVDISSWFVLLAVTFMLSEGAHFFEQFKHELEPIAIVHAFSIASWLLLICHVSAVAYLSNALDAITLGTGYDTKKDVTEWLKELAVIEKKQNVNEQDASELIQVLKHVEEEQTAIEIEDRAQDVKCHDMGIQLLCRVIRRTKPRARTRQDPDRAVIRLSCFSIRMWHLIVRFLLMINGLYLALFFECVMYQLAEMDHSFIVGLFLFFLPMLVNCVVFQPRIFRNYMLLASVFAVDAVALSTIITQFTEVVEARAEFIEKLARKMKVKETSIRDMEQMFMAADPEKTGLIHLEMLRKILNSIGFHYTLSRFRSTARVLFRIEMDQVQYSQVLRLLDLAMAQKDAILEEDDRMQQSHFDTLQNCVVREQAAEVALQRQSVLAGRRSSMMVLEHLDRFSVAPSFVHSVDMRSMLSARRTTECSDTTPAITGKYHMV